MDDQKLARALTRDPNINVPRPKPKRPEYTEPVQKKGPFGDNARGMEFTQPTKWLSGKSKKDAWDVLHPEWRPSRKPVPSPSPPLDESSTDSEAERRKRRRAHEIEKEKEEKRIKVDKKPLKEARDKGNGKGVPQSLKEPRGIPARPPGILPLSPQAARASRVENPDTDRLRKEFPGPGNYEYGWRNDPKADDDRVVRDSIPADWKKLPRDAEMPVRKSANKKYKKNLKYMDGQGFYPMDTKSSSGDCYFAAVSMGLYGTTEWWHIVKYCHLWFFRYVLTHPAHPRYDFYWLLNATRSSTSRMNMWQQLCNPHAWQSSELFSVTADIFNLFIILYEQFEGPENIPREQKDPQDYQTIGLYGQYNATHMFFHIINGNHYQNLAPRNNPETQFPFPDGVTITPRPGWTKQSPPGGKGRPILPPPIAQPIIPNPNDIDITRILGITDANGSVDINKILTWLKREREAAAQENDPTSIKWTTIASVDETIKNIVSLDRDNEDEEETSKAPAKAAGKVPSKAAPAKVSAKSGRSCYLEQ
ncbi:hypothetical protein NHQ30_010449 [Ciborinia camelliae]|nr:hypothetical protein NHQ30_010449 [Ciborinia camelliae]